MDEPESIPEIPRFTLLPEGCRDLYEALQRRGRILLDTYPAGPANSFILPQYPQGSPASVALPKLVSVHELAEAIHLPIQSVVGILVHFHLYVAPDDLLEFGAAKSLCSLCGVEAERAD